MPSPLALSNVAQEGVKCQLITVLEGQTILMEGKRSDTEGSVLPEG